MEHQDRSDIKDDKGEELGDCNVVNMRIKRKVEHESKSSGVRGDMWAEIGGHREKSQG